MIENVWSKSSLLVDTLLTIVSGSPGIRQPFPRAQSGPMLGTESSLRRNMRNRVCIWYLLQPHWRVPILLCNQKTASSGQKKRIGNGPAHRAAGNGACSAPRRAITTPAVRRQFKFTKHKDHSIHVQVGAFRCALPTTPCKKGGHARFGLNV